MKHYDFIPNNKQKPKIYLDSVLICLLTSKNIFETLENRLRITRKFLCCAIFTKFYWNFLSKYFWNQFSSIWQQWRVVLFIESVAKQLCHLNRRILWTEGVPTLCHRYFFLEKIQNFRNVKYVESAGNHRKNVSRCNSLCNRIRILQ